MSWWLAIAGTGQRPYTEADRRSRPLRHRFPRRPRIERSVSTRSIGHHSHIRLSDRQGTVAEQLFAQMTSVAGRPMR